MSDERDGAGSAGDDTGTDDTPGTGDDRAQTTVVTRPQRPTGKRPRREVADSDAAPATEVKLTKNGDGTKKPKAAKKTGPSRNPIMFVVNYLKQVVAELRKVIWPNRKQMVSYTTVVLIFLAFMVALIGGVDLGLAKLITLVFG
ncbi:preprotein translocase subunit SecE [Mycolicibacterium arenosum]|uniref:Protein translocase subunit SecE n=1 Tax=Mycolicibacterium arenosum TaxID=2952157 RepID=A0ABT1M7Z2_9MYCO|nr:preprotein translocase subunit SecE [Mycolicibacterium sp. CAU 1645]MCP9275271.1 preprotein translocase subunit SecE [Mycolicibacterium sp. CAU 1645]